ncbi:type II toxin-antitoxin system VapC family toxin [Desulfurococcus amylolyticus]|uniref:type II toxin-antitoxin system VapC family toxin n=1 Tax=Desulfurococcus amylolyticus TaxID=94694 RepID=UPI000ADF5810|nr:type II toxin-antitoxin system VapC family toxin [Desulfurococcus amylolyticus]
MIYVDTSVIVAALDPMDPRRDEARKTLEAHEDKVVSELVVTELASILARQHNLLTTVKDKLEISERVTLIAIILYIMKRFNFRYINVKGSSRSPIGRFYKPLAYGIELTGKLRLKTLDLLHLAYIKAMKEQGAQIHALLTADADFKNSEEDIRKALGITIKLLSSSPS